MTKLFHIGAVDPEKGHGGVEQFARDLRDATKTAQTALGPNKTAHETQFISYSALAGKAPWQYAKEANRTMLADGIITDEDIVVADGYYGLGLAGKVKRLIIVCHGSYGGMLREYAINPPPSYARVKPWLLEAAKHQRQAYEDGEVVAVSDNAALELRELYGIDAHVIRNGINTELYRPRDKDTDGAVQVAGRDERKGSDMVAKMNEMGHNIRPLGFVGEKHNRWEKFRVAFLPSRYEGGQYAALEAMAVNLQIVTYNSGFFGCDVPSEYVYGTFDYHWQEFDRLLKLAERGGKPPREWVLSNATIEHFNRGWQEYLGVKDAV